MIIERIDKPNAVTIRGQDQIGDYRIVELKDAQSTLSRFLEDADSGEYHQSVFRLDGSFVSKKYVVTRCEICRGVIEVDEKYYVDSGAYCSECYKKKCTKDAL